MTQRFAAINLLQEFCGRSVSAEQLRYIASVSHIGYDRLIALLVTSNSEIVARDGQLREQLLLSSNITQYQVGCFAVELEKLVCGSLTDFLRKNALTRALDAPMLSHISAHTGVDMAALQLFFFGAWNQKFTRHQDGLLRKIVRTPERYDTVADYLRRSGKSYTEINFRIGTLFNVNRFSRNEVRQILDTTPGFLEAEKFFALEGKGAELRFACQLANWYAGNEEHFWAFPGGTCPCAQ